MRVEVGKEYLLTIPADSYNDDISYHGQGTAHKYQKLKEIDGKRVKVKGNLRLYSDNLIVELSQDVNTPFYIPKTFIADIPRLADRCNCTIQQLFMAGCACGAFKREKKKKS